MISKNPSPVNEFSPALWQELETVLNQAARQRASPRIAAFDADGTLWDHDAGETFFSWQLKNCGFTDLPPDPWKHYHDLKVPDPRVAYVWLAQINQGRALTQVREWAEACFAEHPHWPVFQSQRRLIELLQSLDFEIFIVTASIKWAVEPVAKLLGIDVDHVLGITTEVKNGIIGTEAAHPITWRAGKAEGLLKMTGQVRPVLACGNTYGDTALIESATSVRLAVSTQTPSSGNPGLFDEENKLRVEANAKGWLMHAFRED